MWPWSFSRRRLLRHLDTGQVEQAIRRVEAQTSGEIRVSVAGFFRGELQQLAAAAFRKLEIANTRHRNGVLILVAPTRRQVVILGDEGIHARVGASFWSAVTETLMARFRAREFTTGLTEAVHEIGAQLATHFPPDPGGDVNELPDTVDVARGRGP